MMLQSWKELLPGGVIREPGNSVAVETGSWGITQPVIDFQVCVHCMICWIYCPDSSFLVREGRLVGVDYDHCKGCGICAVECPKKCIAMKEGAKSQPLGS